ncbi:MAG: hypothetical protein P3W93_006860, partial [Thermus sp.]|nr:hypothetical protein [Thermus sp.]
ALRPGGGGEGGFGRQGLDLEGQGPFPGQGEGDGASGDPKGPLQQEGLERRLREGERAGFSRFLHPGNTRALGKAVEQYLA